MLRPSFSHRTILSAATFFLLAIAAFVGCSEGIEEDVYVVRNYIATISDETKTSIGQQGVVSWSEGDWIWYYSKDGGLLRMFTVEEDSPNAELQLNVSATANYLVAVHGAGSISEYDGTGLTLQNVIRPVQDGTFSQGHVTVAKLEDVTSETIAFHNLTSFISFSTSLGNIDHLIFTSANGTRLHGNGTVRVSLAGGMPSGQISDGGSSIRVNLSGPGKYYIAVLPTLLQAGFTIECYDADGLKIATAKGRSSLNVRNSSIFNIGSIDPHLLDERGVKLITYSSDTNWDNVTGSDSSINRNGYGDDSSWDSGSGTGGGISGGGYDGDYNWDDEPQTGAVINRWEYDDDADWDGGNQTGSTVEGSGYDDDTNWDNGTQSGGNINRGQYGDDSNWDTKPGSGGGVNQNGYGDDSNWDNTQGNNGDVNRGGYGEDDDWDKPARSSSTRKMTLKGIFRIIKQ